MSVPSTPRATLAVAVASAMSLAAPLAQATTNLNATAEYELFNPDGSVSSSDSTSDSSPTSVSASQFAAGGDPNGTANATAWGNSSGFLYTTAGGGGHFSSAGTVQSSQSFVNDSGVAQQYFFDFTIVFGSLNNNVYNTFVGDQYLLSGYNVSINLTMLDNGASTTFPLWTSTAELYSDASGNSLQTSGTQLGTYAEGTSFYSWGTYNDTLDLGLFDAGQAFELEYLVTSYAAGDSGFQSSGFCGPVALSGDLGLLSDGYGSCFGGDSFAQFGDPNELFSDPMPIAVRSQPVASVPEPGTLGLAVAGLAGLAAARMRKRRRTA